MFFTAGADGYVRTWDFTAINEADPDEDTVCVIVDPLKEFPILKDSGRPELGLTSVKSVVTTEPDHWLVQDEGGGITRVALDASGKEPSGESRQITQFHAGAITGLEASATSDHAVTIGADGTVRVFAYAERREVFQSRFSAPATALHRASLKIDESGRTFVVGFEDGVVRVVLRCADRWKLVGCVKPHNRRVTALGYNPKGDALATGSADGKVFFFSAGGAFPGTGLEPVGFASAPGPVSVIAWNDTGEKVLVGCETGEIVEIAPPAPGSVDASRTYEYLSLIHI